MYDDPDEPPAAARELIQHRGIQLRVRHDQKFPTNQSLTELKADFMVPDFCATL
ncbi:hypothetical protein MCEMSEM22_03182 [Comamonadaceae bacterium]